ncbi:MAG: diaminopimelate decarboxylase [candidate division Zixibacteria bacterium SM23_81]|nr:MAG: diaminopimelate decarboxylase [candidate division Zixibacteria bacterium SM23_81]
MTAFAYREGSLFCDEVDLVSVAAEVGTPYFVYSGRLLIETFVQFRRALKPLPGIICYALKANGNLALLKILVSLGCGADVVSGGELYRALKAGFPPSHIVFAGVGKTEEEIRWAIDADIRQLNVESVPELELVNSTAQKLQRQARVALRLNPDVRADTHPYVATGRGDSKFGLDLAEAVSAYQRASTLPGIQVTGLHFHLGSQILSTAPYVEALKKIIPLMEELRRKGIMIRDLDIGGGLGISYNKEVAPSPEQWLAVVKDELQRLDYSVIIEPGRALMGPAGALVTRVLYLKKASTKNFIVVDAGMNDLVRPSLYGAMHQILPLREKTAPSIVADVVGPVCETADFLARDREMVRPAAGDMLAVMKTGAYSASMSSNYNGRPRAAEVLVFGHRYAVIRKRESFEDMMANELIPGLALEARLDSKKNG